MSLNTLNAPCQKSKNSLISGAVEAVLEVIPPEPNSFIERNKGGIMMFLGVITASGVVKFIR